MPHMHVESEYVEKTMKSTATGVRDNCALHVNAGN